MFSIEKPRNLINFSESDSESFSSSSGDERVDCVCQEYFGRNSSESVDLVTRVQFGSDNEGLDGPVDAVFCRILNKPQGYVYVPVPKEGLDRDQLLATGKAPLWFSTKMSGGIGRSVDLTKKSKNKDDKEPIPDKERQGDLDRGFMSLKLALGLGKHDDYDMTVINYSINGHSVEVYDDVGGALQGKYDLLDKGLNEDPDNPIEGGGGIKQLLRDRGMPYDTGSVEKVYKDLIAINRKIKKDIKPETGGRLAFSFVAENKGNLMGHAPFGSQRSAYADKVLNKDKQQGLYPSTLLSLKHIYLETDTKRKGNYKLTKSGAAAFTDIKKAALFQKILVKNLKNAIKEKKGELELKNRSVPEDQLDIKKLSGEIKDLQKVLNEVRGANTTVRNLAILELNKKFEFKEPRCDKNGIIERDVSGNVVTYPIDQTGKELLQRIPEDERRLNGVHPDDVRGADVKRNDHIDRVANEAADDFGKMVTGNNKARSRNWLYLRKFNVKAQEIDEQVQTDVASLIYQIGALPSSDPSQLRHTQMIEGRKATGIAKESRGLEFIVSASLEINISLRSYRRESTLVQDVLEKSLDEFQNRARKEIKPYSEGESPKIEKFSTAT